MLSVDKPAHFLVENINIDGSSVQNKLNHPIGSFFLRQVNDRGSRLAVTPRVLSMKKSVALRRAGNSAFG